jgi:uncharacterized heparinase superfamily protein
MESVSRYWHTLRHLKAVQLYGRVWHRAWRPIPDTSPPPARRRPAGRWIPPLERSPSMLGPRSFRFLNETRELLPGGWDDPSIDLLWRYNLHYFDDLNAADCGQRAAIHRELIAAWIAGNPPGRGTGWAPYPVSLRIVNWIKWALAGNDPGPAALLSLAVQARWLSRRLEFHLLGNHLFANAKALVFAGCFFEGPEADSWFAAGSGILQRETPEQFLGDGGHFELSPMYHALAVEDLLDIMNVFRWSGRRSGVDLDARAAAGLQWLDAMRHPDGEIAFFNDAAFGIAPRPAAILVYAGELGVAQPGEPRALTHLRESGFVRVKNGEAILLADVGQVGPDYIPGHAHADSLTFELSLLGRRVIVNSGTSTYKVGRERSAERGTAAHNTVVVDGRNSSDVWGSFRVGRRARPLEVSVREKPTIISASHDGYAQTGGPLHRRSWECETNRMVVTDTLVGRFTSAEARFHLHPSVAVTSADANTISLSFEGGRAAIRTEGASLRIVDEAWHPEFGRSEAARSLVAGFARNELRTEITWTPA